MTRRTKTYVTTLDVTQLIQSSYSKCLWLLSLKKCGMYHAFYMNLFGEGNAWSSQGLLSTGLETLCSHVSICFIVFSLLRFSASNSSGLKGGGRLHGPALLADLTIESSMNFFSRPIAWQAKDSEQTSTASGGLVGLNLRSLAYSVKRWNM